MCGESSVRGSLTGGYLTHTGSLAKASSQHGASLVAQVVENLPAMQETWVRSLDWKDPWKKEMATHSSILARRIPWTEPGGLQPMGSQGVGHY